MIVRMGMLVLQLLLLSVNAHALEREIKPSQSKLLELASFVQYAPSEQQIEFTRIALLQVVQRYAREVKLAKLDRSRKTQKIRQWNRSTQAYVDQLKQILLFLDGANLTIHVSRQNMLMFFINDQPVMVDGPNERASRAIEGRVVALFCQQYDCDPYFEAQKIVNEPLKVVPLVGEWLFTDLSQAIYKTSAGLAFEFETRHKRKEKERASKK
ncbi:MAG: hypothetical protein HOM11_12420 [Methylococcales bacterium]|jgi:hypothetical protein|nr:hypothetical protein [Methylococcales bacterium]MBT7442498.1 hypothetical protein [Methylococcales bacterium]